MILFATSNDEATLLCRAVAELLQHRASTVLLDDDACLAGLERTLAQDRHGLLALSHGRDDCIVGQDRLPALSTGNIGLASGRSIFAFACESGRVLGKRASEVGVDSYWGYREWVSMPPVDDLPPEALIPLFELVLEEVLAVRGEGDALAVFAAVRDQCEGLSVENAGAEGPSLQTHVAMRRFWSQLVCWFAGAAEAVVHPEVPRYEWA